MKLENNEDAKKSKYTIDYALGLMSLIVLFISMKFFIAMIFMESLVDNIRFLSFLIDNVGVENVVATIGIISFIFSLVFCACVYLGFIFLDKICFAKLKSGFVFKIILLLLPLIFAYTVRSDIKEFKKQDQDKVVRNIVYNNPLQQLSQKQKPLPIKSRLSVFTQKNR